MLEAARADGLDVAADQYPYTAAATTLATILPPALLGLGVDACVAALARPATSVPASGSRSTRGISGWENVAADPGLGGDPDLVRREPPGLGRPLARGARRGARTCDPADLAFDALVDDRLDVSIVIDCMDETDVETIMAVPWIAVCTDAEGRRPGHPILDAGRPHPRTYGSTARVLGHVRPRPRASSRSRRRSRSSRRCRPPGSACATGASSARAPSRTSSSSTRRPSPTRRPTSTPARYPIGIDHVIVNGRPAILAGAETGERPGRLLRRRGDA